MDDDAMVADRARLLRELVESTAPLKVVVAGPGTGKSHTFKELLRTKAGNKIALTFIVNLAAGLRVDLEGLADVQTLHGFAKAQLYERAAHGVSKRCDYYPSMSEVLHRDASIVLGRPINRDSAEGVLHQMQEGELLDALMASGAYYDAVGYTDSVYRVVRHLQGHLEDTPRYEQVVVDEFQDFSLLEVTLIRMLAVLSPTLIVGDDDQALYSWKHAFADYLRDLVADGAYVRFELPYSSRCTAVLVEGLGRIVRHAQELGLLTERVPKRYECFTPDKRDDSARCPKILHAVCSNESNRVPYVSKYVRHAIEAVPPEDIATSREGRYPTVLVIGPRPFNVRVGEHLIESGMPNVMMPRASEREIEWLDAYRRLSRRSRSRLGWRIAMQLENPGGRDEIIRTALTQQRELFDLIPAPYRERHLAIAALVAKVMSDEALTAEEAAALEAVVGRPLDDVRRLLGTLEEEVAQPEIVEGQPTIVVTSLMGAKGLQAEHVFVVGMNPPHFPGDNAAPEEQEVCEMIVALTRATKRCHLVSCRRFGYDWMDPSIFVSWLGDSVEEVVANKDYFAA